MRVIDTIVYIVISVRITYYHLVFMTSISHIFDLASKLNMCYYNRFYVGNLIIYTYLPNLFSHQYFLSYMLVYAHAIYVC
jgi:hypothetical protein